MPDEPSNDTPSEGEESKGDWILGMRGDLMALLDDFATFTRAYGGEDSKAATHILYALQKCIDGSADPEALQEGHRWALKTLGPWESVMMSRWRFPTQTSDQRIVPGLSPAFDTVVAGVKKHLGLSNFPGWTIDRDAIPLAISLTSHLPGRFSWLPAEGDTVELAKQIAPVLKRHRDESAEEITNALFRFVLRKGGASRAVIDKAMVFLVQRDTRSKKSKPKIAQKPAKKSKIS